MTCGFTWRMRKQGVKHELHSCERTENHTGDHVCNCGARALCYTISPPQAPK